MRIGEKGQVTVPVAMREALGLHPGSTVVFEQRGSELVLRKTGDGGRGDELVARLAGRSRSGMTTDEIMQLTRG